MSDPTRTFRKSAYVQVPCCPKCENRLQDGECERCKSQDAFLIAKQHRESRED